MPVDDLLHRAHDCLHPPFPKGGFEKPASRKKHLSGNKFGAPFIERGSVRVRQDNHLRMSVISLIGVTRVKVDLISYPRST